jgi:hypothetical protein
MLCVLVFYCVCLYRTNQTWAEAARLCSSIKDELARSASEGQRLVVINLPDNLRGVPVYHNGLEEALRVFQKERRIETAQVLSLHNLRAVDDAVELKREGDRFSLQLRNGADEFTSVANRFDCVEMLERPRANSLLFRLSGCLPIPQLFFFNGGRMYRVISESYVGQLRQASPEKF